MTPPNTVSSFQFKRSKVDGRVTILNERSYSMGSYNPKTGVTTWERVVLSTQKANVESWLREAFPMLKVA